MTASEFSFLALGLILGAVSGAAVVELIRARPPAARVVRLTVAHDAIPRRSSTLADDAFVTAGPEPARGGPADRREGAGEIAAGDPDRRTHVRSEEPVAPAVRPSMAGAIPIVPDPTHEPMPGRIMEPALPLTGGPPPRTEDRDGGKVGFSISSGDDPIFSAILAASGAAPIEPALAVHGHVEPLDASSSTPDAAPGPEVALDAGLERVAVATAVGLLDRPAPPNADSAPGATATERCAGERRISEERCELATRARTQADVAADAMRRAQRAYDGHMAASLTASYAADPRAVHEAKERAQADFRASVAAATTPELLEGAARDWLSEINRINNDARDAAAAMARAQAAGAEVGATLERLGLEADAARIGAENADAACLSARVALSECEERVTNDAASYLIPPAPAPQSVERLDEDETLGLALEAGGAPRIFRLLRGDRQAMTTLVVGLAGDDADDRRRWQLLLTGLVEAIVADAIEASALEFPDDHPFWGLFTREQDRAIVQALSSLGYRFDGLGGWTDDRLPSQRDLSLALGYAGEDPMRVRHWPMEAGTAELYRDVTVAADEYLAGIAGDLTLGEMVTMLGRRADGLAEIWNHWGRIRPLLLEES